MPSSIGLRPLAPRGCTLQTLSTVIEPPLPITTGSAGAGPEVVLTGVTLDSRAVRPADLYAALPGSRAHGADFARGAQDLGALAVLTDADGERRARELGCTLPILLATQPRAVLGALSAEIYGHPANDVALLAVTGTNGKTTTTFLMDAVLRASGRMTGLIGTVETRVGDSRVASVRTTPESPDLHALLATMRERGVQVCSMEVSSQALAQHRVDAAVADVAGFTNFSQDHLELHGDMETYLAAKALLFTPERSRQAVVVVDDDGGARIAAQAGVPVTTLAGHPSADADWRVISRDPQPDGTTFVLADRGGQRLTLRCPLPGHFNVMNAALAAVLLLRYGLTAAEVEHGLAKAGGVPGRMEQVGDITTGPLAVVDYAHTPEAVASALGALRPVTKGRMVVVLGAGGDRDPDKRFAMGAAAAAGADVVVVTDDNPRSEPPEQIRAAVLEGARAVAGRDVEVLEIADRARAIEVGVERARRAGDVLLVAGKGHERGQEVAGTVRPFDDREELARALGLRLTTELEGPR